MEKPSATPQLPDVTSRKEIISNIVLGATSAIMLGGALIPFVYEFLPPQLAMSATLNRLMLLSPVIGLATLTYSLVAVKKSHALTVWLRVICGISFILLATALCIIFVDTARVMGDMD